MKSALPPFTQLALRLPNDERVILTEAKERELMVALATLLLKVAQERVLLDAQGDNDARQDQG